MLEYQYKNIRIKGISIGGIETCYILPHFNIAFDVGRCPPPLIDIPRVFLTHGHLDHASGVPYYISQRSLRRLPGPEVYMPPKLYPHMKKVLRLWDEIEGFEAESKLFPIDWDEKIDIQKDYFVQSIPSYHRVASQGYALIHRVKKLREEYVRLTSPEIVRLKKKEGESIFEVSEIPIFAFSGDSTIEFVLRNELIQKTKVLFMECTYIDEKKSISSTREWGHTHLDEIIENLDYFQNEKLVLVHFSKRYRRKQIQSMLEKKVPDSFKDKVDFFVT